MNLTTKIKAITQLKNISNDELAECLGISKQVLNNKYYKDTFTTKDLFKIADLCEVDLCFADKKNRIVLND